MKNAYPTDDAALEWIKQVHTGGALPSRHKEESSHFSKIC